MDEKDKYIQKLEDQVLKLQDQNKTLLSKITELHMTIERLGERLRGY